MPLPRVQTSTVEELCQAMHELPEHRDTEVTRTRALQMMWPAIQAMRSKGYSLKAIATWLSSKGLNVSDMAISHCISRMRPESGGKKPRRGSSASAERPSAGMRREPSQVPLATAPSVPKSPLRPGAVASSPNDSSFEREGDSTRSKRTHSTVRTRLRRLIRRPAREHPPSSRFRTRKTSEDCPVEPTFLTRERANMLNESKVATTDPARIYWVGGSKGGVGKSMMAVALIDYLLECGQKVVLVECDTSNPDVWKTYKDLLHTELVNLDERDGWIHLVNTCDARREGVIVVNTAARSSSAVRQYGSLLDSSLGELGRMVVLWMINRQRDSLELLKEFMDALPHADVHVVRNGYFGEEKKFELYNGSKIRTAVESRGGKSVDLPDLADRVADDLYIQRIPVSVAAKTLPIGNRAELTRWRGEVRKLMLAVSA